MLQFTLQDVRERTYKRRDSWWTVYLVDPIAARLVRVTVNRTSLTPNQLTAAALMLGLGAAGCFAMASWPWLALGALLFHLSFTLDCMDGKVARLTGTGTVFGSWLDYVFDRFRVLVCALALMGGQYAVSGHQIFLWLVLGIVFTDMFRYLNAPQMSKVRSKMHHQLLRALRASEQAPEQGEQAAQAREVGERLTSQLMDQESDEAPGPPNQEGPDRPTLGARTRTLQAIELQRRFNARFPWYARIRLALNAHRVRPHLVSGIEFQMATFIIAPLVGALSVNAMLWTIAVAGVATLAFEAMLVYKLWLSTREFERVLTAIEAATADPPDSAEQPPPAVDAA